MKILVNALSGIGDALMFTPALEKLRQHYPDAQIDALLMYKGVEDIYKRLPEISSVFYFDFINSNPFASLKFVLGLRNKYDVSINVYPSNRMEYNIVNFLIGAKKRAAVNYLRKNSSSLGFLNNISVTENDSLHNVEENIRLVEKLTNQKIDEIPALKFPPDETDLKFADEFLTANNVREAELVVGFHPGCSTLKNHANRRWEPEKFAELGRLLIENKGAKILIFGGPDEKELKEEISSSINSENCVNVITNNLAQTAAVMKRCNVFVSNDSSLMHIAAALQLKVVGIIGPTNTNYIKPWKTESRIVSLNLDCSPCFFYSKRPLICSRDDLKFKCVKEISAEMVYNSVSELI